MTPVSRPPLVVSGPLDDEDFDPAELLRQARLNEQLDVVAGGHSLPVGPTTVDSAASAPGVLAQPTEAPEDESFLSRADKWLSKPGRSDALLAIGAGLLRGDDWASGIAGASENLLQVSQSNRREDLARQGLDLRRAALLQEAAQGKDQHRTSPMGNFLLPDGRTVSAIFDPNHGQHGAYVTQDGEVLPPESQNIGVSGVTKTLPMADKSRTAVREHEETLRALDRLASYVDDNGQQAFGFRGMTNAVGSVVNAMVGNGATEEQIQRAVIDGSLMTLAGELRIPISGPGAQSNIDALRIMQAAGLAGDSTFWRTIATNPDAVMANLERFYDDTHSKYQRHIGEYEGYRKGSPYLQMQGFDEVTPYTAGDWRKSSGVRDKQLSGALDSGKQSPEAAPKQYPQAQSKEQAQDGNIYFDPVKGKNYRFVNGKLEWLD